jgi:LuxR family maltose regulon positive regulatory protein
VLLPFLLSPALALLQRHAPHRTAHASLIAEIRSLIAGTRLAPQRSMPGPLTEPLSSTEVRVLRYLPTNLTAPEIARELSVSPNTVKTHIRNLYAKLGTHGRALAVEHARALGLLAPSAGVGDTSQPRTAAYRQAPRRAVLGRPAASSSAFGSSLTTMAPAARLTAAD